MKLVSDFIIAFKGTQNVGLQDTIMIEALQNVHRRDLGYWCFALDLPNR
jgi:hypothetical protein